MADSAIVRTARALDLIPFVLDHPGISISDLAEHFKTTKSEISETLSILFMCGLPGYTHLELIDLTTEEDEVAILDPQNLDKPRKLSQGEIVSLILGLRNLKNQLPTSTMHSELANLESKLGSLLENMEVLERIDLKPNEIDTAKLNLLQSAKQNGFAIEMHYHSIGRDEISVRTVQPLRIYSRSGLIYFEASEVNGQVRTFRLDRATDFVAREEISISNPVQSDNFERQSFQVEILMNKTNVPFFELVEPLVIDRSPVGDLIKITLEVSHTDWLIRALNSVTLNFEILSPESFIEEFQEFAGAALIQYL